MTHPGGTAMPLLRFVDVFRGLLVLGILFPGARAEEPPAVPVKPPAAFPPLAIATPPKVPIAFNRLYDYPELTAILRKLAAAHPELLSLRSLGKSTEGRDLWCVTINNPKTGDDRSKPAMYVDGNIHGNEIQGAEAALYLIWYLAENRDRVESLRRLTDERVFYVVPTINPDGRAYWFNAPNTTHSSRSGKSPLDDDRDGQADEDGYDDINGDGQITQMRRKDPNGRFKLSPEDPRLLVPIKPGEEVTATLRAPGPRGDRQRRRRPGQRGPARRLRPEPELAGRLAARPRPAGGGQLSRSAGPRRGRWPRSSGTTPTSPASRPSTTPPA